MMNDKVLSQKARYVLPTTYTDVNQPMCYGQTMDRTKLKEGKFKTFNDEADWHNNMFCVQAHAFNGIFE